MCSRPRISFSGWKSLSSAETRLPMFLARSPIRSRSVATRIAPTISRRSIAIGWGGGVGVHQPFEVRRNAQRADDLAQIDRHRLAAGDGQHCALLDGSLQIVDFGVG